MCVLTAPNWCRELSYAEKLCRTHALIVSLVIFSEIKSCPILLVSPKQRISNIPCVI